MKECILLLIVIVLLSMGTSQARELQIIHTNDLHSYFQGYGNGSGGYARLKTKIEELRKEAESRGRAVLQLDAGDFGEGTSFFLTDEGSTSLRALGMLGTEVSVIGNHDHMLGGKILGDQIRKSGVSTKFLSANLVTTNEMNLNGLVKAHTDLDKNGISIRVIGLSTAEAHFQYPLVPGLILPPVPVGVSLSDQAKKEGKELVIALTHIGQKMDVELAKKSSSIDLIVGGHSHDRIEEVLYVKNKAKRQVPVVQAGAHGLVVGSLLVDLQDDGQLKVISYKLHEIKEDIEKEPAMDSLVLAAIDTRNQYFGGRWDEVIGESLVPLSGYINGQNETKSSCWGEHMARMTREAVKADIGLHLAAFDGQGFAPGPITLGNIIENFPHFRNYEDYGWEISTFKVKGKALKIILKAILNLKDQFGADYFGAKINAIHFHSAIPFIGNKYLPLKMRIDGQKIDKNKFYTIALPSELGFALKSVFPAAAKKVFPDLQNTGKYYWTVMEDYVKANSPIKCL